MSKDNNNEQVRLLSEILKWIKFAGIKEVKNTLISVLDTDEKKIAYDKSDGTRGLLEVSKLAGLGSKKPVEDMWNAWLKINLGESVPVRGGNRFKRSFNLEEFGIRVPQSKAVEVKEVKEESADRKPEASK